MAFTVIWHPTAERELTRLWLASRSRSAISEASQRIDELLRTRPQTAGESRSDNYRVLFVEPLGVEFLYSEQDCRVLVCSIWPLRRRR